MGHGKGMNKMQPNKGIHPDPKSLAAFGPGDAQRYNNSLNRGSTKTC